MRRRAEMGRSPRGGEGWKDVYVCRIGLATHIRTGDGCFGSFIMLLWIHARVGDVSVQFKVLNIPRHEIDRHWHWHRRYSSSPGRYCLLNEEHSCWFWFTRSSVFGLGTRHFYEPEMRRESRTSTHTEPDSTRQRHIMTLQ